MTNSHTEGLAYWLCPTTRPGKSAKMLTVSRKLLPFKLETSIPEIGLDLQQSEQGKIVVCLFEKCPSKDFRSSSRFFKAEPIFFRE
jgi:hypothetical protein